MHERTNTHTHTHKQLAYLTVKVHKFTSKKKIADNNIWKIQKDFGSQLSHYQWGCIRFAFSKIISEGRSETF